MIPTPTTVLEDPFAHLLTVAFVAAGLQKQNRRGRQFWPGWTSEGSIMHQLASGLGTSTGSVVQSFQLRHQTLQSQVLGDVKGASLPSATELVFGIDRFWKGRLRIGTGCDHGTIVGSFT